MPHFFLALKTFLCLLYHSLFIHLPTGGHLSCFQVFFLIFWDIYLKYRNLGIAGSYGDSICSFFFVCLDMFSIHLGKYQGAQWVHHMGRVWFSFVRNCQTVSKFCILTGILHPYGKYCPAFPPAMNESSCCFTALPAFGVVSILGFCHSNKCSDISTVVLICSYLNGVWYWASFSMLICHSYIFFGELSIQIFFPLKSGCLFSYCLIFKGFFFFNILDNSPYISFI